MTKNDRTSLAHAPRSSNLQTRHHGHPDICAQVDWVALRRNFAALLASWPQTRAYVSRLPAVECGARRNLLAITHGRRILTLRRFAKLTGHRGINYHGFHVRLTELTVRRKLEVQQSGFLGDSMHHEELVKILEDAPW